MDMDRCQCQDSDGKVCGKPATIGELRQDGMCGACAIHVYREMTDKTCSYEWRHGDE